MNFTVYINSSHTFKNNLSPFYNLKACRNSETLLYLYLLSLLYLSLQLTPDKLGALYQTFIKDYPIVSIEDPFDQDDWEAYTKLTGECDIQIVG